MVNTTSSNSVRRLLEGSNNGTNNGNGSNNGNSTNYTENYKNWTWADWNASNWTKEELG